MNQLYAIKNHFQSIGLHQDTSAFALKVWENYFDDIGKGQISVETLMLIEDLRNMAPELRFRPGLSGNLPPRPLPQDVHFDLVGRIDSIGCPVLFQFGELDNRVNPIESIRLIPKRDNFNIVNYSNTDHSMSLPNFNIQPQYMVDKSKWIKEVLN